MSQSVEFMNALKRLLKMKGIVYQDLAAALELSLPSVKRLFSTGDISLNRLDKICEISGIEFTDLLKLMDLSKSKFHSELTLEQEDFLSENPKAMAYLELLFFMTFPFYLGSYLLSSLLLPYERSLSFPFLIPTDNTRAFRT